ncbi:hypothetical protein KPL74_10730 [Bacillus sp. NP157]|nr:hypothetical protein KPL74_10730 [Bacillus sp. NP157]
MPAINFNRLRSSAFLAAALVASCLFAPGAHAQWAVRDDDANTKLQQIEQHTNDLKTATGDTQAGGGKTVNGNLDAIHNIMKIGTYNKDWPGARVKDPEQKLPADSTKLDDGANCNTVNQNQQTLCKQIVDIENAQYQYMLTMYANTEERNKILTALLDERKNITADDVNQYGKLEDNTNKLTALYNLMQLDQQQMQSVNYAYEANLRYLRAKQAMAANTANTGSDPTSSGSSISLPGIGNISVGQVISGLITGAALQLALDGVATTPPSDMKKLSISKSNGYGL